MQHTPSVSLATSVGWIDPRLAGLEPDDYPSLHAWQAQIEAGHIGNTARMIPVLLANLDPTEAILGTRRRRGARQGAGW